MFSIRCTHQTLLVLFDDVLLFLMRILIGKKEWNKYYYYKPQRLFQRRINNESIEKEIEKVQYCLDQLKENHFIPHTNYSIQKFLQYRDLVHKNFYIIWTAINPPMEHLLYAISEITQPKNILGLGVFTGNPVAWSFGPAIMHSYTASKLQAVEIDPNHAKKGQENFDKITTDPKVDFLCENGFDTIPKYPDSSIDLLYLDANGYDPSTKRNSKNINFSFLKEAYSKLKSGAIALCHNAFQPSFQKEAKMFVEFTDNTNYFNRTATISIDEMGLEFSIKK
jgi:predicted O-methyltransferase YrrM